MHNSGHFTDFDMEERRKIGTIASNFSPEKASDFSLIQGILEDSFDLNTFIKENYEGSESLENEDHLREIKIRFIAVFASQFQDYNGVYDEDIDFNLNTFSLLINSKLREFGFKHTSDENMLEKFYNKVNELLPAERKVEQVSTDNYAQVIRIMSLTARNKRETLHEAVVADASHRAYPRIKILINSDEKFEKIATEIFDINGPDDLPKIFQNLHKEFKFLYTPSVLNDDVDFDDVIQVLPEIFRIYQIIFEEIRATFGEEEVVISEHDQNKYHSNNFLSTIAKVVRDDEEKIKAVCKAFTGSDLNTDYECYSALGKFASVLMTLVKAGDSKDGFMQNHNTTYIEAVINHKMAENNILEKERGELLVKILEISKEVVTSMEGNSFVGNTFDRKEESDEAPRFANILSSFDTKLTSELIELQAYLREKGFTFGGEAIFKEPNRSEDGAVRNSLRVENAFYYALISSLKNGLLESAKDFFVAIKGTVIPELCKTEFIRLKISEAYREAVTFLKENNDTLEYFTELSSGENPELGEDIYDEILAARASRNAYNNIGMSTDAGVVVVSKILGADEVKNMPEVFEYLHNNLSSPISSNFFNKFANTDLSELVKPELLGHTDVKTGLKFDMPNAGIAAFEIYNSMVTQLRALASIKPDDLALEDKQKYQANIAMNRLMEYINENPQVQKALDNCYSHIGNFENTYVDFIHDFKRYYTLNGDHAVLNQIVEELKYGSNISDNDKFEIIKLMHHLYNKLS